jgi:hypothetical protein
MDKYIIEWETIVGGETKTHYHEKMEYNSNDGVMNVYVEHITSEKKKALRFYNENEAINVARMFHSLLHRPRIKKVKR